MNVTIISIIVYIILKSIYMFVQYAKNINTIILLIKYVMIVVYRTAFNVLLNFNVLYVILIMNYQMVNVI